MLKPFMSPKKNKTYAVINSTIILMVIFWNYWANSSTLFENTVGELSDKYNSLFTPAGYAFAIWGIIFLGLVAHGVYQLKCAFTDSIDDTFIEKIGPWLSIANIANGAWIWFWLNEYTGMSVIVMTTLMISLIVIIIKLNMERWEAPKSTIFFVWWPICIYAGWIAVAMIANISAHLTRLQWSTPISSVSWTIIMILVATIVNIAVVYSRNMREFAAVGIWSLIAIAIRHSETYESIQWTAILCAFVLFIIISVHGYQNRSSNPFIKKCNSN